MLVALNNNSVIENTHLFMITSQGNVGSYYDGFIKQAVDFITDNVMNKSANIVIGFDGDGVGIRSGEDPRSRRRDLAEKVPTPSSTALLIVLRLINLGYTNVMLAQCQVAGYCGLADDYNNIYCTASDANNEKEIILELYKEKYGVESKRIKLVDVAPNEESTLFSNLPEEENQEPVENPGSVVQVKFVTIGYNGENAAHYENVTVDYGMGGKVSDKLLVTLPSVLKSGTFTVDVEVRAKNGKRVDLYGGTSHVASDLSGVGEPAGSTAGWLKSTFLTKFKKKYLIVFWDNTKVKEGDNTMEMSICKRTFDLLSSANYELNGIKQILQPYFLKENSTGGSRRKSKKSGIRTNGARKSRKLRR
jgi:hypothetical protein